MMPRRNHRTTAVLLYFLLLSCQIGTSIADCLSKLRQSDENGDDRLDEPEYVRAITFFTDTVAQPASTVKEIYPPFQELFKKSQDQNRVAVSASLCLQIHRVLNAVSKKQRRPDSVQNTFTLKNCLGLSANDYKTQLEDSYRRVVSETLIRKRRNLRLRTRQRLQGRNARIDSVAPVQCFSSNPEETCERVTASFEVRHADNGVSKAEAKILVDTAIGTDLRLPMYFDLEQETPSAGRMLEDPVADFAPSVTPSAVPSSPQSSSLIHSSSMFPSSSPSFVPSSGSLDNRQNEFPVIKIDSQFIMSNAIGVTAAEIVPGNTYHDFLLEAFDVFSDFIVREDNTTGFLRGLAAFDQVSDLIPCPVEITDAQARLCQLVLCSYQIEVFNGTDLVQKEADYEEITEQVISLGYFQAVINFVNQTYPIRIENVTRAANVGESNTTFAPSSVPSDGAGLPSFSSVPSSPPSNSSGATGGGPGGGQQQPPPGTGEPPSSTPSSLVEPNASNSPSALEISESPSGLTVGEPSYSPSNAPSFLLFASASPSQSAGQTPSGEPSGAPRLVPILNDFVVTNEVGITTDSDSDRLDDVGRAYALFVEALVGTFSGGVTELIYAPESALLYTILDITCPAQVTNPVTSCQNVTAGYSIDVVNGTLVLEEVRAYFQALTETAVGIGGLNPTLRIIDANTPFVVLNKTSSAEGVETVSPTFSPTTGPTLGATTAGPTTGPTADEEPSLPIAAATAGFVVSNTAGIDLASSSAGDPNFDSLQQAFAAFVDATLPFTGVPADYDAGSASIVNILPFTCPAAVVDPPAQCNLVITTYSVGVTDPSADVAATADTVERVMSSSIESGNLGNILLQVDPSSPLVVAGLGPETILVDTSFALSEGAVAADGLTTEDVFESIRARRLQDLQGSLTSIFSALSESVATAVIQTQDVAVVYNGDASVDELISITCPPEEQGAASCMAVFCSFTLQPTSESVDRVAVQDLFRSTTSSAVQGNFQSLLDQAVNPALPAPVSLIAGATPEKTDFTVPSSIPSSVPSLVPSFAGATSDPSNTGDRNSGGITIVNQFIISSSDGMTLSDFQDGQAGRLELDAAYDNFVGQLIAGVGGAIDEGSPGISSVTPTTCPSDAQVPANSPCFIVTAQFELSQPQGSGVEAQFAGVTDDAIAAGLLQGVLTASQSTITILTVVTTTFAPSVSRGPSTVTDPPAQIPSVSQVPSGPPQNGSISVTPSTLTEVSTPSFVPSIVPSLLPSTFPSLSPTTTTAPSPVAGVPTNIAPILIFQVGQPSISDFPTFSAEPSSASVPSADPSLLPSRIPSLIPSLSAAPSLLPSLSSSPSLSASPSVLEPTGKPSMSLVPSSVPSVSVAPSGPVPSNTPSVSNAPSVSANPTAPTVFPSFVPSSQPSNVGADATNRTGTGEGGGGGGLGIGQLIGIALGVILLLGLIAAGAYLGYERYVAGKSARVNDEGPPIEKVEIDKDADDSDNDDDSFGSHDSADAKGLGRRLGFGFGGRFGFGRGRERESGRDDNDDEREKEEEDEGEGKEKGGGEKPKRRLWGFRRTKVATENTDKNGGPAVKDESKYGESDSEDDDYDDTSEDESSDDDGQDENVKGRTESLSHYDDQSEYGFSIAGSTYTSSVVGRNAVTGALLVATEDDDDGGGGGGGGDDISSTYSSGTSVDYMNAAQGNESESESETELSEPEEVAQTTQKAKAKENVNSDDDSDFLTSSEDSESESESESEAESESGDEQRRPSRLITQDSVTLDSAKSSVSDPESGSESDSDDDDEGAGKGNAAAAGRRNASAQSSTSGSGSESESESDSEDDDDDDDDDDDRGKFEETSASELESETSSGSESDSESESGSETEDDTGIARASQDRTKTTTSSDTISGVTTGSYSSDSTYETFENTTLSSATEDITALRNAKPPPYRPERQSSHQSIDNSTLSSATDLREQTRRHRELQKLVEASSESDSDSESGSESDSESGSESDSDSESSSGSYTSDPASATSYSKESASTASSSSASSAPQGRRRR